MSSDSSLVRLDVSDAGVAHLVLASPGTGNAYSADMARDLRAAVEELARRDDLRVVVLAAEGKAFCVGGDLAWMAAADDRRASLRWLAGEAHASLLVLLGLDAPLVAKVQGVAAGIGMSFVGAADIAIAGQGATFTVAYTGVGLSPDGGASWILPRLVGQRRAAELMLTNRRVTAAEALAYGFLTEVVPDGELDATVEGLAGRLAAGPTRAYGAVKRLLREGATATLADQLDAEAESIADLAASPTGVEGVDAFLAKRRPEFPA